MNLVPLALIPICSILNHLGGQSTTIPDPRFVARMLGQGLAFGIVAFFSGWPIYQAIEIAVIGIAGFSFWAVWMWGPGFMAINGEDHRDYTKYKWINWICDHVTDVNQLTILTHEQARQWGAVYMTVRGAFMYPMFIALAHFISPWALLFGVGCLLQGIIYYLSATVLEAEYIMGGLNGFMLAAILFQKIFYS